MYVLFAADVSKKEEGMNHQIGEESGQLKEVWPSSEGSSGELVNQSTILHHPCGGSTVSA